MGSLSYLLPHEAQMFSSIRCIYHDDMSLVILIDD
jgi:hypothetical protein